MVDTRILVEAVRQREMIYNSRHVCHSNKAVIERMWNEISEIVGCPATACRERWTTLRSNFCREVREIKKRAKGCTARSRRWYLYDRLKFLLPYIVNKRRTALPDGYPVHSLEVSTLNEYPCVQYELDDCANSYPPPNMVDIEGPPGEQNEQSLSGTSVIDENCDRSVQSPVLDPLKQERCLPDSEDRDQYSTSGDLQYSNDPPKFRDADELYLLSLLPYIKQLSPGEKLAFRLEVDKFLYQRLVDRGV